MAKAVDKAYQAIRALILGGAYPSGSRLKEEELADRVGVSRTPVREALRRLDSEQLIRFIPNHGAYVAAWSRDDIEEIFFLRSVLECSAVERAASRITEEELDSLEGLQRKIELASLSDSPSLELIAPANYEFHRIILLAARSERLMAMLVGLIELPQMLGTYSTYTATEFERSAFHHREIIAAMRARDGVWASSVMRAHHAAARNKYISAKYEKALVGSSHDGAEAMKTPLLKPVRLAS